MLHIVRCHPRRPQQRGRSGFTGALVTQRCTLSDPHAEHSLAKVSTADLSHMSKHRARLETLVPSSQRPDVFF